MFFFPFFIYAQNHLIDSFTLSASGITYGVYADINCEKETNIIFFDLQSPNKEQEIQSCLNFSEKNNNLKDFIEELIMAKNLYSKWKSIATLNGIKLLSKKMPVRLYDHDLYFTDKNKWYYEKGVDMWFTFYVEEGNCYLILESDYMTSEETIAHSSTLGFSFRSFFSGSSFLGVDYSSSKIIEKRYCSGSFLVFSSEAEIDVFISKLENVAAWKKNNIIEGKLLVD
jgi:hypothetical protein